MAGSVDLYRKISASGYESPALYNDGTIDYVSFSTLDSAQTDPNNGPVGPPSVGTSYSREVALILKVSNPPDNYITNVRFWTTGSNPEDGVILMIGSTRSYTTPALTKSAIALDTATLYNSPDNSFVWSQKRMSAVGSASAILYMQYFFSTASYGLLGNLQNSEMVYHYSYDQT